MYQLIGIYSSPYCGKWTTLAAGVAYVGFPGGSVIKNLPAKAADAGDTGLIPGWGKSYRVGNGNSLQFSCLENSTDRGAWQRVRHDWAWHSTAAQGIYIWPLPSVILLTVWSGHSRWLFSSLWISSIQQVPASPTCCLHDWPPYVLAPGPSWWLFLWRRQWGACPSASFPSSCWVSLIWTLLITGSLLPLQPGRRDCCHPLHMVGAALAPCFRHASSPYSLNHWCLCYWHQALSLVLEPGKHRTCRPLWVQPNKDRGKIYSFYKSS